MAGHIVVVVDRREDLRLAGHIRNSAAVEECCSSAEVVEFAGSRCYRTEVVVVRRSRRCTEVAVMGRRTNLETVSMEIVYVVSRGCSRVLLSRRILLWWWSAVSVAVLLRRRIALIVVVIALTRIVRHGSKPDSATAMCKADGRAKALMAWRCWSRSA